MTGAYRKPTELATSTEDFDLSEVPDGPRLKYVVCSTQRSGSYLLCRQLINANLGVPHEYYNALHIKLLCDRWGLRVARGGAQAYVRELYARRTTSNGVWGAKLQWLQYLASRPLIDTDLSDISRYIFLYRTDVASQAVSLHLSLVSGRWGFEGQQTTPGKPHIRLDDLKHVAECAQYIEFENKAWLAYFNHRQVTPMQMAYEDYVSDQAGGLERVGNYLGLDPSEYQVPRPEPRSDPYSVELETVRQSLLKRFRQEIGAPGSNQSLS